MGYNIDIWNFAADYEIRERERERNKYTTSLFQNLNTEKTLKKMKYVYERNRNVCDSSVIYIYGAAAFY